MEDSIRSKFFPIKPRVRVSKNARKFTLVPFATTSILLFLLHASRRGIQSHWNDAPVPVFTMTTNGENTTSALPHIFHILTLPTESPFASNMTARLNPTWTLKTYDAYGGAEYMETNCKTYSRAYRALKPLAFKADLLRYCIL